MMNNQHNAHSWCRWLAVAATAVALMCLPHPSAHAQAPTPPPATPTQGLLDCASLIGQPLVKVPEIASQNGVLKGTILLGDQQVRMAFRTPPGFGNVPGGPGLYQVCQPQYVRYFWGVEAVPPPPPGPGPYPDPLPGPTLRARVGDMINLTFLNQINPGDFGNSIDRAENGLGNGCDESTGSAAASATAPQGYPQAAGDVFPDCFHGSSTGNIHFHGTHTNPNGTGDNVLIEVRPSPRVNNEPTVKADTVKAQFDKFFAECNTRLRENVLAEWPQTWNDKPLGPPTDPSTWTAAQMKLLQAYDANKPDPQKLWPTDAQQVAEGLWPQYYIGAYPYCFRIPAYTSREWPPAMQVAHAGHAMGPGMGGGMGGGMAPNAPSPVLQMGQSPGTHWYHAHKHGSTAINVANGMTGAFIIEGQYDDDINAVYGAGWTRKQPVLVINQIGVTPNLLRKTPTDKGPDFSVNGRLQPVIKMYPGEVQMWRILNTSGRSGAFFVGPPAGFEWMQLAQDGVQFADVNYQKSKNKSFLMASGNRVDLLVKAPLQPQTQPYAVQVQPAVAKSDLPAPAVTLVSVQVTGSGPEMHFLKRAPYFPPFLADITNDEIKGTKNITFNSLAPGSPFQHTINGQPFSGEVGVTVLLNTAEEWKIMNATNTATGPANIDHPFHIHINPFQVTEVFDPNETVTDPSTNKPVNKYVFSQSDKTLATQCLLDPNNPESWRPCTTTSQPYEIWWDVFPIPSGRQISVYGRNVIVPGYFKMRSRFVDYPGLFVIHCHILAHEDRGMMMVVEVRPRALPYAHR
jgi:FtsP/CotA-like multicopper oxidase with cupredoxin domain